MKNFDVNCPPRGLVLGYAGENIARGQAFDFSAWAEEYGAGSLQVALQRPGDAAPYPVALTVEGTVATWLPTETDLQEAGTGQLQLIYTVGEVRVKTLIVSVLIGPSLGSSVETPAPGQAWIDQLTDLAAETEQHAASAAQSAENAAASATGAQRSATDAENAKTAAVAAAGAAAASASHYPQIVGGVWYVWSPTAGEYISTGIDAQGEDGVSPTVEITAIQGGHRVVITDAAGPHTFDVLDGVTPDLSAYRTAADQDVIDDAQDDQIADLKSAFNEVVHEKIGLNLIDPNTIVDGEIWSGQNPQEGNYSRTSQISVEASTTYTFALTSYQYWVGNDKRARFVAYFDIDKNIISVEELKTTFTTPDNCAYVALTFKLNNHSGLLIEGSYDADTQTLVYVPFAGDKRVLDGATITNFSTSHIDDYAVVGKNLFDPSKITPNSFLQTYPQVNTSDISFVSDYIKVSANETYVISNDFIDGTDYSCRSYVLYDEKFQKISSERADVKSKVITPTVNGYLRFTGYTNQLYRTQVELGDTPTAFEPFKRTLNNTALLNDEQIAQVGSVLFKKKWAVCGDSFTNSGGTGSVIANGLYKGRPYTYPWIIGNRQNMEIVKFFEGGRTLAFPANPASFKNSLTNPNAGYYYQNIPADVDYITIYLGINDEHHATGGGDGEDSTGVIPLGTINDADTSTYYGAWNVVLSWLIANRPNAHIGIIVTNGLSLESYRTAQIEIARKYGIPFIDMNGDDRTPAMLRTVNPNIATSVKQALIAKWAVDPASNTHPNDAAQLFESTFIENFLRSI